MSSPLNLKLNDLEWHHVKLTRNEAEIQLVLDDEHTSRYTDEYFSPGVEIFLTMFCCNNFCLSWMFRCCISDNSGLLQQI